MDHRLLPVPGAEDLVAARTGHWAGEDQEEERIQACLEVDRVRIVSGRGG
jgi:hypothetical protein